MTRRSPRALIWSRRLAFLSSLALTLRQPTMAPQLPPELLRSISRNISRSKEADTLSSASLVSSDFRGPFQEQLFSTIIVYKLRDRESNTAHHLEGLEIFHANASLLPYIKTLYVGLNRSFSHSPDTGPIKASMVELLEVLATSSHYEPRCP